MTRVLFLIKGLGRGGAEQLLLGLSSHLDRDRFSAEVAYVLPEQDALAPELEAAGWAVTCLGGGPPGAWVVRLLRLLREREIDLVHAHSPQVAAVARTLVPRGGPPFVYTEHAEWEMYRRPTYWANALTFPRNDLVLAVSDEVRRSARYPRGLRFLQMPPVETLHHGIDLAALDASLPPERFDIGAYGVPRDAPVVGTIANFRPEKGHRYLLEAAVEVREAVPEVRFVLVGGGPLDAELRAAVSELGLERTVVFAGYRRDAAHVATAFDVFVLPSLHEGLPIALVEALALGKPVVATRAGGSPEVVESGREGLIVARRDPHALAEAILQLLRDPALRERMGQAGRERAAYFDIRRAVDQLELAYDRALSAHDRR